MITLQILFLLFSLGGLWWEILLALKYHGTLLRTNQEVDPNASFYVAFVLVSIIQTAFLASLLN